MKRRGKYIPGGNPAAPRRALYILGRAFYIKRRALEPGGSTIPVLTWGLYIEGWSLYIEG
jgi:hypothetical protein